MQIRDLPFSDPGDLDVRSGRRFLLWLARQQLGGQLKSLGWGLLHQCGIAGLPLSVGVAVQAVVDRSGSRLALAGGLILLFGAAIAVGDTLLHRTTITNWITAAARVQHRLARKTAELGSVLTRRVAAGEVVAVCTGDVEKIGWFVEALCGPVELALESTPSSAPPSAGVTPPRLPWRPRTSTAPVTVSRTERGSPCRW
jgi:hypothetical protein